MLEQVRDFYTEYNEDGRLGRHSLELVRSQEIISRYLRRDPMRIADIGGASGAYSFWLASQGHDVCLLDITPKHIGLAMRKAEETGIRLAEYRCADARELPYADESFDLVLVMGPLYHLQRRGDRIRCLGESRRALKTGCPVLCAVISRYASMVDGFKYSLVRDERFQAILKRDLETGCHHNPERVEDYFTDAYFHTAEEIRDEMSEAGFADVRLIAVEGFANALNGDELCEDAEIAPQLLECIRITESVPELMGVSGHIIAAGTK